MEFWLAHTDEVQRVVAAGNSPAMTDLLCIAVCWHRFRVIKLLSGHAVRSTLPSAVKNVLRKKWCMCWKLVRLLPLSLTPYLTSPHLRGAVKITGVLFATRVVLLTPLPLCLLFICLLQSPQREEGGPVLYWGASFCIHSTLFSLPFERLGLYFQQSPLACLYHYSLILSSSELLRGWFKELGSRRVFSFLTLTQNNQQGLTACLSACSLLFCLQYFKTFVDYLVFS